MSGANACDQTAGIEAFFTKHESGSRTMKIVDRRHMLVLASFVLGIAAAVLIAQAGTADSDHARAGAPISQMIVPF